MLRYLLSSSILFLLVFNHRIIAQDSVKIYNPYADARQDLQLAIKQANLENKHVLVQIGGNWCPWCIRLHHFFETSKAVDSILKADYVLVRINYSKENRNPDIMAMLGFPQRFGFPVLVEKVKQFLLGWNKTALDPSHYNR